jgi:hypothetical protein
VKLGRGIEALDGASGRSRSSISPASRSCARRGGGRAFANWTKDYRDRRRLNRQSALLANFEAVVLTFLQPAATVLVLLIAWQSMKDPGRAITTGTFVAFHAAMFALLGACARSSPPGSTSST